MFEYRATPVPIVAGHCPFPESIDGQRWYLIPPHPVRQWEIESGRVAEFRTQISSDPQSIPHSSCEQKESTGSIYEMQAESSNGTGVAEQMEEGNGKGEKRKHRTQKKAERPLSSSSSYSSSSSSSGISESNKRYEYPGLGMVWDGL